MEIDTDKNKAIYSLYVSSIICHNEDKYLQMILFLLHFGRTLEVLLR